MNKKNSLILAAIVAVLTLAYFGIISVTGFTSSWSWLRAILFCFLTYALALIPMLTLLYVYETMQKKREEAMKAMKDAREQRK